MTTGNGKRPHGPFSDILIIDLTRVLAGPFCTMLFADLGARVIKIEQPGTGDDSRGYGPFLDGKSVYFNFVNRGKESIALDLKDEHDRALLVEMARRADVVVENFRPGTMDKLGLSFEELAKVNPRLIYASCSGFGHTGPMSRQPAYDTVVQALSGLMSITGAPDGPPTRAGISVADLTSGVYLFGAVASALYAREKSGHGARVDIAMLDGMFSYLVHGIMEYTAHGKTLGRLGNGHPSITPFDTYQAADEILVICVGGDEVFARLCRAIGREDMVGDARFHRNPERHHNQHALRTELEATLKTKPVSHWIEALSAAGVPCAKVQTIPEAIAMPQIKARNMMVDSGGLKIPGNPLKISGFDDPPTRPAAPALDANGDTIRREFGATSAGTTDAER
ncbi:MAG: CoA transferase [Candidatus Binataceae bacterium]